MVALLIELHLFGAHLIIHKISSGCTRCFKPQVILIAIFKVLRSKLKLFQDYQILESISVDVLSVILPQLRGRVIRSCSFVICSEEGF